MAIIYTDDLLVGGTPSADSEFGAGYEAELACDGNAETLWSSADTAFPHWWKYDFGDGVSWTIIKATIKPVSVGGTGTVKDFNIQGSNNDSDWTTLCTDTLANNINVQTFTFTNAVAYRYIKVNITSTYSGSYNHAQITEFEMMAEKIIAGGFSGFSPWIFMKDMWEKHNKIWKPNKKILTPQGI